LAPSKEEATRKGGKKGDQRKKRGKIKIGDLYILSPLTGEKKGKEEKGGVLRTFFCYSTEKGNTELTRGGLGGGGKKGYREKKRIIEYNI